MAGTIIGVDPHPGSFTAVAVDVNGLRLGMLTVNNDISGIERLRAWADVFPERCWGVEGASNRFARSLTEPLASAGELVVNVSPNLTAQYRARRTRTKNDSVDAENAARACLANPDLPVFDASARRRELQDATRARDVLRKMLQSARAALVSLSQVDGACPAAVSALAASASAVAAELKLLDEAIGRMARVVAPGVLSLKGVGPVLAGVILAEMGDARRFRSEHAFASFCGAAPVQRASGGSSRWCVNGGGNRRLNWVLHLMALVRLRCDGGRSRAFVDRKLLEGKTKREALRALKTVIARELYRTLRDLTTSGQVRWNP